MATERGLLDALHARLATDHQRGTMPPRHVLAEHVQYHPAGGGRIADALSVDTWGSGYHALSGYEVKTTRADWRRELADPTKAQTWRQHCTFWWLVTIGGVVVDDLPEGWGMLVLRGDGRLARKVEAPRLTPVPLAAAPLAGLVRAVAQTTLRRAGHVLADPEPTAEVLAPPAGLGSSTWRDLDQRGELPLYDAANCPLFDCQQTAMHAHPERHR